MTPQGNNLVPVGESKEYTAKENGSAAESNWTWKTPDMPSGSTFTPSPPTGKTSVTAYCPEAGPYEIQAALASDQSGKTTACANYIPTGVQRLYAKQTNNASNWEEVEQSLPIQGGTTNSEVPVLYVPYTEDENGQSTTSVTLKAFAYPTSDFPEDSTIPDWSTEIDGQTYPQNTWDGQEEVTASQMEPGTHTISVSCGNTLSINVVVRGVDIQELASRNSDDIQVQCYENDNGTFTYTAIPFQLYYKIWPDTGWSPDDVTLEIRGPGGMLIRTITLPANIGEQDTAWDGKSNSGEFPEYGLDAYTATITVVKGDKSWFTTKTFSIYEIRQGNCVYRPTVGGHEHAAILYEYTGANSREDLESHDNYTVAEHPGSLVGAGDTTTSNLADHSDWISPIGWCPPALKSTNRRSLRESILETCENLVDMEIDYIVGDLLDSTVTPWDGNINHIDQLRCDGFVEFAYETNSIRLFGPDEWWDITASQGNLDKHNKVNENDVWPERQRSSNATTNQLDALFLPNEF